MTENKTNVDVTPTERRIKVNDQIMYKNILGEWHPGVVIKVNNTTVRILNKDEFKILSLKWENVLTVDEYKAVRS